jgi:hypothetical protein
LEQSKLELTGKNYHLPRLLIDLFFKLKNFLLSSKSEPELIDLLAKASAIQTRLADKLAEHHTYLNVYNNTKKKSKFK